MSNESFSLADLNVDGLSEFKNHLYVDLDLSTNDLTYILAWTYICKGTKNFTYDDFNVELMHKNGTFLTSSSFKCNNSYSPQTY